MKPEEALAILDRVASQTKAVRDDHVMLQQAVATLREELEKEA